jgi:hypothetical protein
MSHTAAPSPALRSLFYPFSPLQSHFDYKHSLRSLNLFFVTRSGFPPFFDPLKAPPNHDNFRACDWTYVLYDHRAGLRRAATSGASGRLEIPFHSR